MASKRPRPYDVPPSPESSEEEEVEGEEVEEEEEEEETTPIQTPSKQQDEDGDEDEDEDGDGEEEDPEEGDEEDEESDEPIKETPKPVADSGSDTETDTTPKPSNFTIKPVAKFEKAVKGSKGVKEEDEKKGNSMINRVWSFDDEIYVMQAMIDFKKDYNKDPTSSHEDFFNFVKGKLCNDKFTKVQVMDKIRRLKKKYRNNLNKSSSSGKDPDFSNPHEFKSFRFSKKIWGDLINNVGVHSSNSNAKGAVVSLPVVNGGESNGNGKTATNKSAKKSKTMALEKVSPRVEEDVMEVDEEKGFGELYPHLMKAFEGESVPRVPLLDGLKGCLSTVESSKLEEWDRKWKKVRVAETDAYLGRLALIHEQTSWFSDAMKSSKY